VEKKPRPEVERMKEKRKPRPEVKRMPTPLEQVQ
jgi:hypothetical protein